MEKTNLIQCVYIVVTFGNIVGVYANADDAYQQQKEFVNKNRPADVLCRSIVYPLK